MKKILVLLLSFIVTTGISSGKETRRELRKAREKERMEEVLQMVRNKELRFVASTAHPMGGIIHLTSLYTLDIVNDSISAWLPFYGVAYSADYGGGEGGIKFNEIARFIDFKEGKKGPEISMEVKTPREFYRLHLSITRSGSASLIVSGSNKQSINFMGNVEKLKKEVKVKNF